MKKLFRTLLAVLMLTSVGVSVMTLAPGCDDDDAELEIDD